MQLLSSQILLALMSPQLCWLTVVSSEARKSSCIQLPTSVGLICISFSNLIVSSSLLSEICWNLSCLVVLLDLTWSYLVSVSPSMCNWPLVLEMDLQDELKTKTPIQSFGYKFISSFSTPLCFFLFTTKMRRLTAVTINALKELSQLLRYTLKWLITLSQTRIYMGIYLITHNLAQHTKSIFSSHSLL